MKLADVKDEADRILEEWDDICNQLGLTHFIYLGTCLGFYREQGYIKWDEDLDVGVLVNEQQIDTLAKELLEHGYTTEDGECKNKHWYKNGVLLDIWTSFPRDIIYLQAFDEVDYNGRTYNMPRPVEEYLEAEYGNWRVPDRK